MTRLSTTTPVVALNLLGEKVEEYDSIHSACKALFFGRKHMNVWSNLIGHTLRAGNYHFVAKEVYNAALNYSYNYRKKLRKFKKLPQQNIPL